MRKPAKLLLTAAAALLLLALALHLLLQPQRVTGFVLNAPGDALGPEITATGSSEYRLRGTPVLVVHDIIAREPGAATLLPRARRVHVSVPRSPVRSRAPQLPLPRTDYHAPRLTPPPLHHEPPPSPPAHTPLPPHTP